MRGRTVFATFKPVPELQNSNLRDLRNGNVPAALSHGDRAALERAITQIEITQIDQAAQRRATPPTSDIELGAPAPSLG